MFRQFIFLSFLLIGCCLASDVSSEARPAFVLEGIHLPETKVVDGVTLFRNGEGVRLVNFFGMNVRVYVAGFWTADQLQTVDQVMACDKPKQFDFTFLRSVSQGRVTSAWTQQLDASVTFKYTGYDDDRKRFIQMFGPIQNGGTETILLIGDELHMIDQGILKGIIRGKNFQRAFLSMWFGEQAVADDLKSGLLGHSREQVLA